MSDLDVLINELFWRLVSSQTVVELEFRDALYRNRHEMYVLFEPATIKTVKE